MSGQVYAEKNAGRRIKIYVSDAGPRRQISRYPFCYVVGYDIHNADKIYVEFEDARLIPYCTASNLIPSMVRTCEPLTPQGMVWGLHYKEVRFLRPIKNDKKKVITVNPYPHTCSKCNSPARNFSTYIMCSNSHCKINKKFKQEVLSKVPKLNRLRCPTCRGYATEVGAARGKNNTTQWRFSCGKRHTWTHEPKNNDIVTTSIKPGEKDRIFNNGAWKLI